MFRIRTGDVCVAAFTLVVVIGILMMPGGKPWKYFTNQVLFAIAMYFATRWLVMDRAKFETILKWILVAAAIMLADLALVQLTRVGGLWTGARGPLGTLSDQTAYSALFPPLFLYLAATVSGRGVEDGGCLRRLWAFQRRRECRSAAAPSRYWWQCCSARRTRGC